ncbi:hypothetical protein [uncultured Paludibaculum sp.]|uniref:hypothetical protein n=1 Tax=uncultured Paludibaculum sp. TaxID=1765020 RepID=UPI002AAA6FA2|nr:hypothetical protein [uncultured Paludibaculum sp.]
MREPFTPEQIEMLLGGYATGTLTADETKALMDAALRDQRLFDALMDEEALRETLADADTRAALLAALRPVEQARAWWRTPWLWAAAATAAVALLVLVYIRRPTAPTTEIAQNLPEAVEQIRQKSKPEPQAAEIRTPSVLSTREAPAPERPDAKKEKKADTAVSAERSDAPGGAPGGVVGGIVSAAAPPPPPPPPASAPVVSGLEQQVQVQSGRQAFAERGSGPRQVQAPGSVSESVRVQAAADSVRTLAKAAAPPEPLQVALAFLQPDGTWHEVAPDAAMPAGRGLRLTVTSQRGGMLSLQPALAPPHQILAGTPLQVYLPPRRAGEVPLRLQVGPVAAADAVAKEEAQQRKEQAQAKRSGGFRGLFGRAKTAAPMPPPPPAKPAEPPLRLEILLKIEENR